jgi:hypothetical protein
MTYRTLFNRRIGRCRVFADYQPGYISLGLWMSSREFKIEIGPFGLGVYW